MAWGNFVAGIYELPAILEISSNLKIHIMKTKDFVLRFLITFGIGLIASILVTLCWNYFIKGNGLIVDWETSFRTALILAIVLPLTQIKNK